MNWEKVHWCRHDWSPRYLQLGRCSMPNCVWAERHCLKCGVYEMECGCGFCNGLSGIPHARRLKLARRLCKPDTNLLPRTTARPEGPHESVPAQPAGWDSSERRIITGQQWQRRRARWRGPRATGKQRHQPTTGRRGK